MAVFGIFLMALTAVTGQMIRHERRLAIDYLRHPQIIAVITRMRRDVLDAHGAQPYRTEHAGWVMNSKTLIVEAVQPGGGVQTVVWDFNTPGQVHRIAWNVGVPTQWIARGVPADFSSSVEIDAVSMPGRPYGVRLMARDQEGRLAIDQIFQPRAKE
jgi:hypothetical protein